ncbi:MAG TPA: hypothetical protein VH041_16360 [Caldimonas sp.]|jgi:predicted nuclease with RNAse H fold|nr:hypothetical protein [Caldimonas sp.]
MNAAARRSAAMGCLFALAGIGAHAATVFRCGDSYPQASCANAKAIEVDAPISAAQRAEARAVAAC